MLSKRTLFFWVVLLFSFSGVKGQYPFQDTALPVEQRVGDLISRLTLKEKVSLMLYNSPAVERLGIPPYNWWNEALHGVARAGKATVFPQAIGMAATFDDSLIYEVADAISDEARAKHNAAIKKGSYEQYTGLSFWSPNINIFRDPRWGRGQETYGEDPFLTSKMGMAFVKGMQGDKTGFLKTSACAKHFAVHSGPEESRHRFNALPERVDLQETYFPAFKALVENGVESVMCAYNRLYDAPCCASKFLLDTVLRRQWGFKGHVVSDCWALDDIWARHKTTNDKVKAAAMAAKAGVNLNCGYLFKYLPEAVEKGFITESLIDTILQPLLHTRFKLGLLDAQTNNPYAKITDTAIHSGYHKKLALRTARESIVLLKNKDSVLPLDLKKLKKLFVTGPTANDLMVLVGNYNGYSGEMVTLLEGMINKVDGGTVVQFSQGTLLSGTSKINGTWLASGADATIACIGNSRFLEGENGDALLNENGGDRTDLRLPENQIKLIRQLREKANDKPLIVVITGGSAVALPEIEKLADAILFVWYPGEQGGNAVADVIFGDYNPAGRLPVTFYKSIQDLPPFDDYDMFGRTYRFFKGKPQFEFGYGLSYSRFEYSNPEVRNLSDTLLVKVSVKNSGDFDGDEVVQLYVREESSRRKNPIKSLKGFRRVFIPKGKTQEVVFKIPFETLKHWSNKENKFVLGNNPFEIQIGASSKDIRVKEMVSL